jgi:Ca2+-binding EF-hand superfamily protein
MPMAARHFAAIDKDNKGYVTLADIHTYLKEQRALRHPTPANG